MFLLLNYDMDTDMYAGFITIEKRNRLPGSISTRKSLNQLERGIWDNKGEDTFVVGHLALKSRYGEASIRSSSFDCDRRR